jgi:dihydroneopterin aldolase
MRNGDGANAAAYVQTAEATPRAVTLEVPAIRLEVRLGCEAAERAIPQGVEVELRIRFADLPAACWTDDLEDTVCYAALATLAREHCAAREFRLIERLALELAGLVRARLPEGARLTLTVVKLAPPVPELVRGVRFTIDDR